MTKQLIVHASVISSSDLCLTRMLWSRNGSEDFPSSGLGFTLRVQVPNNHILS